MAFTERQRERAYEMFANDVTTDKVASKLRLPVNSVRSLRAHWTMGNTNATSSSRSRTSGSVSTYTLSLSQARRVAQRYYAGDNDISIQISS
jgi:hypothetical protein